MPKTNEKYNPGKRTVTGNQYKTQNNKAANKKSNKTLEDLLEEGLKDIYSAEHQLVEALPKLAKAADNEYLKDAFNEHLRQTERHVERLEKIFERLNINKNDKEQCEAMEGLVKEADEIIDEFDSSPVRDSALIIAAQKIEHYEIASYGSLRELADVLRHSKIVDILHRTLMEEEDADKHLTSIAQDVNDEAYETSPRETEMA